MIGLLVLAGSLQVATPPAPDPRRDGRRPEPPITEEQRAESYTDFYMWNGHFICVVMKDGTRIELWDQENDSAIDLTQVDYVLLPDGTKLPVPEQ